MVQLLGKYSNGCVTETKGTQTVYGCYGRFVLKEKKRLIYIVLLQGAVLIYSFSSVMSKLASAYPFFSFKMVICYGTSIGLLGVYAILWQQFMKKVELSVAYANRSMNLLWSMVWSVLLFHETMTVKNVLGVILVLIGTIFISMPQKGEHES